MFLLDFVAIKIPEMSFGANAHFLRKKRRNSATCCQQNRQPKACGGLKTLKYPFKDKANGENSNAMSMAAIAWPTQTNPSKVHAATAACTFET
jgi:hypothetical protein